MAKTATGFYEAEIKQISPSRVYIWRISLAGRARIVLSIASSMLITLLVSGNPIRRTTPDGIYVLIGFYLIVLMVLAFQKKVTIDHEKRRISLKESFSGLRFRDAFYADFDSIEKFVVYGMNQPFWNGFSRRQPKLAIGMQLKDSIEKVNLLVMGFDDKTLVHEARAIATFVDRPLEIAPSVVVLDAE